MNAVAIRPESAGAVLAPLSIERLQKNYGGFEALKQVSFEMQPGEIFGLLGPNGAGKTTLISIATGLLKATGGHAAVFGRRINVEPEAAKRLFGVVPQELVSHGFFTVEEVLHFHSGYYGLRRNKEQIDFLLEKLDLKNERNKLVSNLSGGMKRRLLIAKALVHKPRLLILDEPTAGVDISLRLTLWDFVRELNRQGTSILLTTHYLEEAEELCHRVGIIHEGELKKVDDTKKLIAGLTNRGIQFVLNKPVAGLSHAWITRREQHLVHVEAPAGMTLGDVVEAIGLDLHDVKDVQIKEGDLASAFVKIIGDKRNGK